MDSPFFVICKYLIVSVALGSRERPVSSHYINST
jgi:hypothetical protein